MQTRADRSRTHLSLHWGFWIRAKREVVCVLSRQRGLRSVLLLSPPSISGAVHGSKEPLLWPRSVFVHLPKSLGRKPLHLSSTTLNLCRDLQIQFIMCFTCYRPKNLQLHFICELWRKKKNSVCNWDVDVFYKCLMVCSRKHLMSQQLIFSLSEQRIWLTDCNYFSDCCSCLVSSVGRNPTKQANTMATFSQRLANEKWGGGKTTSKKNCSCGVIKVLEIYVCEVSLETTRLMQCF